MNKKYDLIGLMSGTSTDGLDIVYCTYFFEKSFSSFNLHLTHHVPYSNLWKKKLKRSIFLDAQGLLILDKEYGSWVGEQVRAFIHHYKVVPQYVASHGHTVFHLPEKKLTYQIGDGQCIASKSGVSVICDFRSKDVSYGGQGAPLVPIGDRLLFGQYDFCINLGGISNISFEMNEKRTGYDMVVVGLLLDYLSSQIGLSFDDKGKIAKSGSLDKELFNKLNELEYYKTPPPKSTDYEWFLKNMAPIFDSIKLPIEIKLHTAVHHITTIISKEIKKYKQNNASVLLTGGGAKNDYLVEKIILSLGQKISVVVPEAKIIDYKEAIIFGLLGVLKLEGEVNCLSSITGAIKDTCSGVVYHP